MLSVVYIHLNENDGIASLIGITELFFLIDREELNLHGETYAELTVSRVFILNFLIVYLFTCIISI